jgi:hypothetical protein
MPVTWEIRDRVLIVNLVGNYAFDEPVQAVDEGLLDPQFRLGTSLLIDARLAHAHRTSEDMHRRAEWVASLQSRGISSRCAIVIRPQPNQFGVARMATTHHEMAGLEMDIFTDFEAAFRWLCAGGATSSATE